MNPIPDLDRITADAGTLAGKPCIRGTRLSVQMVLKLLADYPNQQELFEDYPELVPQDIAQTLEFAARMLDDRFVSLGSSAA